MGVRVGVLIAALALSGCSSSPDTPTVTKTSAGAPTTTAPRTAAGPTTPAFRATGLPPELASVIKALYLGGTVRSSLPAAKVLTKRKPLPKGPVTVNGYVDKWKGVPIAVVTSGKDVTLAVAAPKWKVVGGWWPSVGVKAPSLGGTSRRVLMIGSDARPGEPVNSARADSLHIVGVDGRGGGGVVGIARDAYVPLATGGRGKINSALTFGGPEGMQRTVAAVAGVPIEGYLITGFDGFQKLINGLGGLPIHIPTAITDSLAGAQIKAGANTLDGRQALSLGRARHGVVGGDFGRSENQGRMIVAAAGVAKRVGPTKLPRILAKAAPAIGTNLSAEQLLTFAASVYVTSPAKVPNKVAKGGFVLLDANARALFADIRDGNLS